MGQTKISDFFYNMHLADISVVTGGLTNKSFCVNMFNQNFMVRFPGKGTYKFISRKEEHINEAISSKLNISPKIYYFDVKSGIKISHFIDNAYTLNNNDTNQKENIDKFTEKLKKLHNSKENFVGTFDFSEKYQSYKAIGLENASPVAIYGGEFLEIEEVFYKVIDKFKMLGYDYCSSHNDILAANLILDSNQELFIVDFEYSSINDKNWDLCSFICECELTKENERYFLEKYYGTICEIDLMKINLLKVVQNFLWAMWALSKYSLGDETIIDWGKERFERSKQEMKQLGFL